ncbi:hypothetical protein OG930_38400 [Streptomyces sp. NBC_01799]|nr:hypothetical protein OG930_38400 [Streptomyces sp. NBC_01799]
MQTFRKALIGATASLALAAGIVGTTAGSASASEWRLCTGAYLQNQCWHGPDRQSGLAWLWDESFSSIETNGTAMEVWTKPGFKGDYGYFAPWGYWPTLTYPYENNISSFSYPGV